MKMITGIAAVAVLVLAVSSAPAATVTVTGSTGFQSLSPFSPNPIAVNVAQFDPSLGTLTKVEIILGAWEQATMSIENGSVNPAPVVSIDLTGLIQAVAPGSLSANAILSLSAGPVNLAANEGPVPTYNGSGLDFHSFGLLSDTDTASNSITSGMGAYIGLGTVTVNVYGQGGWGFNGTSDAQLGVAGFGGQGDVTVKYYYNVPEPITMSMLGLGGLAMVLRRRR